MPNPNYEYVNLCLMDWGQAVFRARGRGAHSEADPFLNMEDNNCTDIVSARAFTLACFGLACAEPLIGKRLTDTFGNSSAFSAWRNDVLRKNTQKYYDAFETCIMYAMCTKEQQAIADQFPAFQDPARFKEELHACRLRSGLLSDTIVMGMIDKVIEGRQQEIVAAPKLV
jgi:hypothetical protein